MFVSKPLNGGKVNEVKKSCGKNKDGRWYCISCDTSLRTNLAAQSHDNIHKKHKIVWDCDEHGFETCTPYDPSASQLE